MNLPFVGKVYRVDLDQVAMPMCRATNPAYAQLGAHDIGDSVFRLMLAHFGTGIMSIRAGLRVRNLHTWLLRHDE